MLLASLLYELTTATLLFASSQVVFRPLRLQEYADAVQLQCEERAFTVPILAALPATKLQVRSEHLQLLYAALPCVVLLAHPNL